MYENPSVARASSPCFVFFATGWRLVARFPAHIVALVITLSAFLISPVDLYEVYDPAPGSYTQSGTISSSVSITRTGP